MKKYKILISIALIISLMLSIALPGKINAISINNSEVSPNEHKFVCRIMPEDTDINVQNIEIKVYSAEIADANQEDGYIQFDETYCFSVYTNEDGIAIFTIPSKCFSITVNIETLPQNTGVNKHTQFYANGRKEDTIYISEITNVILEEGETTYYPLAYDKYGKTIYAKSETEIEVVNEFLPKIISLLDLKKLEKLSYRISAKYYGKVYSFTKDVQINEYNVIDKAEILFINKVISEGRYIELLSDYILDKTGDYYNEMIDGTSIYLTLKNYYDSASKIALSSKTIEAMNYFTGSTTSSTAYVMSASGHFRVYYDNQSMSPTVAQAVANEFDLIDAYFCTTNSFPRPEYDSSYYKIELVPNDGNNNFAGQTTLVGLYGSYIKIRYDYALDLHNSGWSSYPDAYVGILAHEYWHAILFRKMIWGGTSAGTWFHESTASMAGCIYESDYVKYNEKWVNRYLNTPNNSLLYYSESGDDIYRHYGSLLFPLYIYQVYGGWNAIKSTLNHYTTNPISAIENGLGAISPSYTVASAYSGHAGYNYDPDYFYGSIASVWGQAKLNGDPNTLHHYAYNRSWTNSELSSYYYNFQALTNIACPLSITIDLTISGNANPIIKTIRTTASGSKYISTRSISSNRCTIMQNNFNIGSSTATTLAVCAMNAANSGTVSYSLTANYHSFTWSDYSSAYHVGTCSLCSHREYEYHYDYWNGLRCLICGRTDPVVSPYFVPYIEKFSA